MNNKIELVDVVDANGDFTGEILDKEVVHDRNLLHNEVACMIINNKRQVLLQKRAATKRFSPNKYALCAGHVDSGEALEDAMIREIKEEIGLEVEKGDLKKYCDKKITIQEMNSHITYYYYIICNLREDEFVIQEEELSEVKWFDVDDIIEMLKNHDERIVWREEGIPLFERVKKIEVKNEK